MSSYDTPDDSQELFDAAEDGRLKEVIELSSWPKFSEDVNVLSEALICSCRKGHLEVVKWFVQHTVADVNYNNSENLWSTYTPLTAACEDDHLDIVKYLVETCFADVNIPGNGMQTPLIMANKYVSTSVSKYFLCEVSVLNVNFADGSGNTALHYAVWCNKDSYTQLHDACDILGDVTEVLRLICVNDHKIDLQDNMGYTPLLNACHYGRSDIVETLMLAGADDTITNDEGQNATQVAKKWGHRELLELLDRDSLQQVMLWRRKKLKLPLVLLIMLILRMIRLKQTIRKWHNITTVVHVLLTVIRSVLSFDRKKRYKLKRKASST